MNGGVTVSRLRVVSGNNYTQRRRPIFGCRRAKFTSQTLLSPDPKNPVSGNICYNSTIQIRPYSLVLQFAYFCKTQESYISNLGETAMLLPVHKVYLPAI